MAQKDPKRKDEIRRKDYIDHYDSYMEPLPIRYAEGCLRRLSMDETVEYEYDPQHFGYIAANHKQMPDTRTACDSYVTKMAENLLANVYKEASDPKWAELAAMNPKFAYETLYRLYPADYNWVVTKSGCGTVGSPDYYSRRPMTPDLAALLDPDPQKRKAAFYHWPHVEAMYNGQVSAMDEGMDEGCPGEETDNAAEEPQTVARDTVESVQQKQAAESVPASEIPPEWYEEECDDGYVDIWDESYRNRFTDEEEMENHEDDPQTTGAGQVKFAQPDHMDEFASASETDKKSASDWNEEDSDEGVVDVYFDEAGEPHFW